MNILLVGSGGREHAIAWKISKSDLVNKIYIVPGNAGTEVEKKCENIKIDGIENLLLFAKDRNIDLTIVGPEEPLINGIVDRFEEEGLKIFGPSKRASLLEGSKSFAKNFMKKYGVSTAGYEVFEDINNAKQYLKGCNYPVVIKADGLAAGKGVVICKNKEEAIKNLKSFMLDDIFKGAGRKIIIEEYLVGVEASILSITDGDKIIPFISAKDHKQIFDGGIGPNTGGMGAIAPNPYVTEDIMKDFEKNILKKTLFGIKKENFNFKGIIFFGLMITKTGVKLLEYNVRMGDPETQVVLPLMENDLVDVINKAIDKELYKVKIKFKNKVCVDVVLSSKGYPGKYENDKDISIKNNLMDSIFVAGAKLSCNKLKTNGGRVLSVIGIGDNVNKAREIAYENLAKVNFEGMYYRKDIGECK